MKKNFIDYLLNLLKDNDLEEIEYHSWFSKIKISRKKKPVIQPSATTTITTPIENKLQPPHDIQEHLPKSPENQARDAEKTQIPEAEAPESQYEVIRSPMVGTFYRSPAPGQPAFINTNDSIKPGSILCIIEAMKTMNEIEAEISGTVVEILVENEATVEYNQPLFYVKP